MTLQLEARHKKSAPPFGAALLALMALTVIEG